MNERNMAKTASANIRKSWFCRIQAGSELDARKRDIVYMHLQGTKTMKDAEKSDLEKFRDEKRREMVNYMKEHGFTYEDAADAMIDMLGENAEEDK